MIKKYLFIVVIVSAVLISAFYNLGNLKYSSYYIPRTQYQFLETSMGYSNNDSSLTSIQIMARDKWENVRKKAISKINSFSGQRNTLETLIFAGTLLNTVLSAIILILISIKKINNKYNKESEKEVTRRKNIKNSVVISVCAALILLINSFIGAFVKQSKDLSESAKEIELIIQGYNRIIPEIKIGEEKKIVDYSSEAEILLAKFNP